MCLEACQQQCTRSIGKAGRHSPREAALPSIPNLLLKLATTSFPWLFKGWLAGHPTLPKTVQVLHSWRMLCRVTRVEDGWEGQRGLLSPGLSPAAPATRLQIVLFCKCAAGSGVSLHPQYSIQSFHKEQPFPSPFLPVSGKN